MNTEELAEELYNLIVIKGRKRPERFPNSLFGHDFAEQPDFIRDAWMRKAEEFAELNSFRLDD